MSSERATGVSAVFPAALLRGGLLAGSLSSAGGLLWRSSSPPVLAAFLPAPSLRGFFAGFAAFAGAFFAAGLQRLSAGWSCLRRPAGLSRAQRFLAGGSRCRRCLRYGSASRCFGGSAFDGSGAAAAAALLADFEPGGRPGRPGRRGAPKSVISSSSSSTASTVAGRLLFVVVDVVGAVPQVVAVVLVGHPAAVFFVVVVVRRTAATTATAVSEIVDIIISIGESDTPRATRHLAACPPPEGLYDQR